MPLTPRSEAPSYHSDLPPLPPSTVNTPLPDTTTLANNSWVDSPINYNQIAPQADDNPITSDDEVVKALIIDDFECALREGLHE
jgi:hypothetical protein